MLSYKDSSSLLRRYGIPMPKTYSTTPNFPVVLKVDSPEVIHKTDLGLVKVGIKTKQELEESMAQMKQVLMKNAVKNYSFIIQEQVKGIELVMGMKKDPSFGPVILFGLGGIYVEVLNDVSMRIAPLSKKDCLFMINEIKSSKILDGYRNSPKVDTSVIIETLLKLSSLVMKEKNIAELDFNPVIVNGSRLYVADVRIIYA